MRNIQETKTNGTTNSDTSEKWTILLQNVKITRKGPNPQTIISNIKDLTDRKTPINREKECFNELLNEEDKRIIVEQAEADNVHENPITLKKKGNQLF